MTGVDFVSARTADLEDLPCLVELASRAVEELRDDRGGASLLFHDLGDIGSGDRYARALASAEARVALGLVDGVCVGYTVAVLSKSAAALNCMIEELFVHVEARGVGVGAALLLHVREWGQSAGCQAIESHVLPGNRAAKNFFERVGMVTRKMQVSVEL